MPRMTKGRPPTRASSRLRIEPPPPPSSSSSSLPTTTATAIATATVMPPTTTTSSKNQAKTRAKKRSEPSGTPENSIDPTLLDPSSSHPTSDQPLKNLSSAILSTSTKDLDPASMTCLGYLIDIFLKNILSTDPENRSLSLLNRKLHDQEQFAWDGVLEISEGYIDCHEVVDKKTEELVLKYNLAQFFVEAIENPQSLFQGSHHPLTRSCLIDHHPEGHQRLRHFGTQNHNHFRFIIELEAYKLGCYLIQTTENRNLSPTQLLFSPSDLAPKPLADYLLHFGFQSQAPDLESEPFDKICATIRDQIVSNIGNLERYHQRFSIINLIQACLVLVNELYPAVPFKSSLEFTPNHSTTRNASLKLVKHPESRRSEDGLRSDDDESDDGFQAASLFGKPSSPPAPTPPSDARQPIDQSNSNPSKENQESYYKALIEYDGQNSKHSKQGTICKGLVKSVNNSPDNFPTRIPYGIDEPIGDHSLKRSPKSLRVTHRQSISPTRSNFCFNAPQNDASQIEFYSQSEQARLQSEQNQCTSPTSCPPTIKDLTPKNRSFPVFNPEFGPTNIDNQATRNSIYSTEPMDVHTHQWEESPDPEGYQNQVKRSSTHQTELLDVNGRQLQEPPNPSNPAPDPQGDQDQVESNSTSCQAEPLDGDVPQFKERPNPSNPAPNSEGDQNQPEKNSYQMKPLNNHAHQFGEPPNPSDPAPHLEGYQDQAKSELLCPTEFLDGFRDNHETDEASQMVESRPAFKSSHKSQRQRALIPTPSHAFIESDSDETFRSKASRPPTWQSYSPPKRGRQAEKSSLRSSHSELPEFQSGSPKKQNNSSRRFSNSELPEYQLGSSRKAKNIPHRLSRSESSERPFTSSRQRKSSHHRPNHSESPECQFASSTQRESSGPRASHSQSSERQPGCSRKRNRSATESSSLSTSPSPIPQRTGHFSAKHQEKKRFDRRFWTEEEENLLIEEIERHYHIKNCMAEILMKHGRHGSVSKTLAHRTGVQLKDKAINLSTKWYKEGIPLSKKRRRAFSRFPAKNRRKIDLSDESSSSNSRYDELASEDELVESPISQRSSPPSNKPSPLPESVTQGETGN